MIVFPLSLKPTGRPIREAAAWFISGEKPAAWLEELSQWGVELAGVALLALPVAPGRKTPCGVLAVPPAGSKPAVTPRAQPYGALAGRLYLPANSRLDPEVSEDELRVVIPWHALVLHPALGPVGFRREQTLGVADLIEAPPARGRRWNSARQAESAELRLLSVESEAPASLDAVLQEAKDDIGTRKTEELPRQSDRPTDGNAGLLGKWARRQVAQTVNWLAGKVPGGAGANTWVNDVQDWARKRLDDWGSSLELARHRELLRLLRMLDTDPDEGLKYALPLKGFGARGVAEPGMKLGPREPSFSLDRVSGGRPADVWSTPWQIRAKLSEAYRKQAEREVALKRFRRAAYIYAELLGDFESAAAVLKQGRHFREAAVLYRDHLRRPIAAAHCLEEGGLLLEAIPIYEAEGQHLQAGLLYQRLERAREAEEAFRAAAEMLAAQGNLLGAAQLLETKLAAPEEALVLLASGWPASAQASKCLVERLNLLGRLRRHDEALRLLPRLAAEQLPPDRMCLLAESFSAIARAYPDREVRGRAADLTRVAAGKRLPEALPGETVGLVAAVSRLAPEDRLLARDAQRYIARSQRRLPSAMPLGASARKIVPVAEVRLSPAGEVQWQVAATAGDWLYAAGHNKARRIVLARMGPERALERLRWYKPLWDQELPILATPRHSGHPVLVWLWGGVSPGHLRDHPVQQFGDGTPAGSPAWLPGNTVALCYSDADIVWVLKRSRGSAPALASFTSAGELLKTLELGAVSESSFGPRGGAAVPMAAQSRHVFVATTRLLHQVFETGKPRTLELPGAIHGLALSPPNSRLRVAAVLDEGGVLFWPARVGETTVQGVFGERLYRPKAALLGDGSLIALTRKEGRLYDTGSGRVRLVSSFEGPGDDLLAVQPCRRPEEFVVVTREGLARTYRVTGR